ncbi:MAG: hypothetical protein IKO80_03905 [Lachnospiraceae bacterium]|nr:hypothetical protein [Lachnospiraceae bacterium]
MILKETFRMQNHLNDLMQQAMLFLSKPENILRIKEEHQRSRSNPNAQDETVEVRRESDMTADRVIELYLDLIAEREKLAKAISKAKAGAELDIDAALSVNKAKQEAISRFRALSRINSTEEMKTGKDYLINTEGNQTAYVYNIRSVSTIDFNRETLKGIVKRLQRECDEVSAKIDLINVTLEVDYTPKYDIDDTFEDAYGRVAG